MSGSSTPGYLLTKPFVLNSSQISVNAAAETGSLLVEVCDHLGRTFQGFGRKQAVPIQADGLRLPIRFNGVPSLDKFRGRTIRLRMQLAKAGVFGLAFS